MKSTVRQIAAGTVLTVLFLVGYGNAKGTELKVSDQEIIETSLQLENWMKDETIWNTSSINTAYFVEETETEMELESWMISEDMWNVQETAVEEELLLENWMVDAEVWR